MAANPVPFLTPEEYLAIEREANERHGYRQGAMWSMAGGTEDHSTIASNTARGLGNRLSGRKCRVHAGNPRLWIESAGLYTYPDLMVIRGESIYSDNFKDCVTNPLTVIEVLSNSTEGYDRGEKFEMYRTLQPLQEYVLISQKKARVERFRRKANGRWELAEWAGLDSAMRLESLGCEIPLSEIYEQVEFGGNLHANLPVD
jgi:Uma2 family endonuclease